MLFRAHYRITCCWLLALCVLALSATRADALRVPQAQAEGTGLTTRNPLDEIKDELIGVLSR